MNPRGAMHPYLLSREAHSTGLCDVSSADYSRIFSPRARTAPAASAQEAVGLAEGEGFEPPVPLLTQRFSRPSLSATQTALQTCLILQEQALRRDADNAGRAPRTPRRQASLTQAGDASARSRPCAREGQVVRQDARHVAPIAPMRARRPDTRHPRATRRTRTRGPGPRDS